MSSGLRDKKERCSCYRSTHSRSRRKEEEEYFFCWFRRRRRSLEVKGMYEGKKKG
jgi:hypothetical protein